VTASVGFFRSIGGAMGVGLMGALFNALMQPHLRDLRARGIAPAGLLDPHELSKLPPEVLLQSQHAIASSLTWVFAAMLVVALLGCVVTMLMPGRKSSPVPQRADRN
jgi:hypothetical protein